MSRFIITGSKPLYGEVSVSGSKNAALPILAATLLTEEPCLIRNVPDIEDVQTMLALLRELGSEFTFFKNTVSIQTRKIYRPHLSSELVCRMRASILLIGPLVARSGKARLPYPGGCVLGTRPIDTHTEVFRQLGVVLSARRKDEILFEGKPRAADLTLPEFSVTATENALLAAARNPSLTTIRLAAAEPHVQDLCRFLSKIGVQIRGIGSHLLEVRGKPQLTGAKHRICPDYLEAGTFVLAAAVTRGDVTVKNIAPHDLDSFWGLLREMEVPFELGKDWVRVRPATRFKACKRLQTNVFPGFPTDLQPPFVILLTQASGESMVHETLFEGRFAYFPDLLKMGARIQKQNPHEAVVTGPVALRATKVKSWDIRAGAAMIVAALCAKGETVVEDIQYIDRGYERFDEKLRGLGARIRRE